jgi:hypothetical protein
MHECHKGYFSLVTSLSKLGLCCRCHGEATKNQCWGSGSVGSIIFGHPGSAFGSISQRYGSGSFYNQAKIVRKTFIPTVLLLLYDFLSLKNDVNVPSKSKKQKNSEKKICLTP